MRLKKCQHLYHFFAHCTPKNKDITLELCTLAAGVYLYIKHILRVYQFKILDINKAKKLGIRNSDGPNKPTGNSLKSTSLRQGLRHVFAIG